MILPTKLIILNGQTLYVSVYHNHNLTPYIYLMQSWFVYTNHLTYHNTLTSFMPIWILAIPSQVLGIIPTRLSLLVT